MLIRRNTTRTIKNTTETTRQTDTPAATTLAFALTTSDYFYLGFKKPFTSRYFHLSTVNSNAATLTVKFWDGSAWTAVEDLIDETIGFTQSGFISWQNPGGWTKSAQSPITDLELYWLRINVSANLSAGTILQAVLNLFCNDDMLRAHYPELITDTRYLPDSRTDFLEQYVAAKDLVVTRLKRDQIIDDESKLIDLDQVSLAAVHAAAYIILHPISRESDGDTRAKDAKDAMDKELSKIAFPVDVNDSGVIETAEEKAGNDVRLR